MQGPIGRIGKPPDRRAYQRFEVKGIVLFIEQGLVEQVGQKQGALKVFMGDYGTWVLYFRDVLVMVAVDGCQVGCARAILKNAQVPLQHYLVLTDEGIEKNKNFKLERADIDRIKDAIKRVASQANSANMAPASACGCGCTSR